jgi:hypothetical protein
VPATPFQFAFFLRVVVPHSDYPASPFQPITGNARREYRGSGGQLAGPGAAAFHDLIAEIRDYRTPGNGSPRNANETLSI